MIDITAVLSIMTHEYNTRSKKDSAVTSESLQNQRDIIKNINSVKDKIINLKETVNKRLREDNEKLREMSKT